MGCRRKQRLMAGHAAAVIATVLLLAALFPACSPDSISTNAPFVQLSAGENDITKS
ncbi:MAG: hypothetical protein HN368_05080, partial [Spirochaetales bacterium]|nr:hypothetical protein [Spirochaetales bacterium]